MGYTSFSAYVTRLIRYDLLVGGPKLLYNRRPAAFEAAAQAHAQKHLRLTAEEGLRKILLDHLIKEAEGRPVPQEELQKVKAAIATALRPFIQALSF